MDTTSAERPDSMQPSLTDWLNRKQPGAPACRSVLEALRELHLGDPIFVERKRDFLNMYTESDAVVATMAGQVIEYEVKTSRADFMRDRHKLRNQIYYGEKEGRKPNRFFYATAQGIVTEADIPGFAGWYEMDGDKLTLRHRAPRLHRECHGVEVLMQLARAMRNR